MSPTPLQFVYQDHSDDSSNDTRLLAVACREDDPQAVATHLKPLNAAAHQLECWYMAGKHQVTRQSKGIIEYTVCGDTAAGYTTFAPDSPIEEVTSDFYRTMLRILRDCGDFYPLRLWHYLPQMHSLHPPTPYQRFCTARASALRSNNQPIPEGLCAATVVCNHEQQGLFYFLASAKRGLAIENPRQISAYEYPPEYGNIPPLFSRGVIHTSAGRTRLYISGTASIIGSQTVHHGSAVAQLDEIANNLESLIFSAKIENDAFSKASLGNLQCVKIYLKDAQDYLQVVEYLPKRFPKLDAVQIFNGQLCRKDLLVEIEGMIELQ